LAAELQGHVELPALCWKYKWMKPVFGLNTAMWAQRTMPESKSWFKRHWDKAMFRLETLQDRRRRTRGMGIAQADQEKAH